MAGQYESKKCNGYYQISKEELPLMEAYCGRYMRFLETSRTEKATVANAVSLLEQHGFLAYKSGMPANPGDRYFFNIRNNALLAVVIGKKPLGSGMQIVASHVDSPRLEIRPDRLRRNPNPLSCRPTITAGCGNISGFPFP